MEDYLEHYGRKGMHWYQHIFGEADERAKYKSTGIRSAIARRQNEKIDKSFKQWKTNDQLKSSAVEKGKAANQAKMAYDQNRKDKNLKKAYQNANKEYKKALRSNTTYRKGQIRQEVGSDISRKYLSQAKRIKKQLDQDPTNKSLQKEYNRLMSLHDVERAKARKAPEVGAARSRKIASMKRVAKGTIKAAATVTAIKVGTDVASAYIATHPDIVMNAGNVERFAQLGKDAFDTLWKAKRYMY